MFIGDISRYTLEQIPEAPCATCGFSRMCRDQLLACRVFSEFVDRGKFDRDAPRRPTSRIYGQIFGDEGGGAYRRPDGANLNTERVPVLC
jgi:hypothetical protein